MWVNEIKTFIDAERQIPVSGHGDFTLTETAPHAGGHSVKVRGLPADSAVLKLENNGRALASFWSLTSPCNKVCDALVYTTHKAHAYVVFFELKSGTLDGVRAQFLSTQAAAKYILEAVKLMSQHEPPGDIRLRYVLFSHRRLDKRVRQPKQMKKRVGNITVQETNAVDVNFTSLLGEH